MGQAAPAGDICELLFIQRIKRYIDAAHACCVEFISVAFKLGAVGCKGQLFECAALKVTGHCVKERHNAFAHERLAARDAQFFNAKADKCAAHAVKLLKGEQLLFGQKRHVFGHAVDTAEIATVCHGDAQVRNRAGEGINQRRFHALQLRAEEAWGKGVSALVKGRRGA